MTILKSLIKHDKEIFKKSLKKFTTEDIKAEEILMIGVDEVGRGCLAGPVCTAAYSILNMGKSKFAKNSKIFDADLMSLNDSKLVKVREREPLCKALKSYSETLWAVDFQPAEAVDQNGIVNCIWTSMTNNIRSILASFVAKGFPKLIVVLVDGPKTILGLEMFLLAEFSMHGLEQVEQIAIVKGDSKSAMIAAASNIAKDIRDKYMHGLAKDFTNYGWITNVGYGTLEHRTAIEKHGPCQYHRMSFIDELHPVLS